MMMPEVCDRCAQPFDNLSRLELDSQGHPIISEVGPMTYYLCEDCTSQVLLLLSEPETSAVAIRLP